MKTFRSIIESNNKIVIPTYQRAYAWGEKQVKQFVNDLQEINGKTYYYGHFIIEENESNKTFEIIDGQQRITTFVLFLLASKKFINFDISDYEYFIKNKFETISYDTNNFKNLIYAIIEGKELNEQNTNTSSFIRIEKAIEYFGKYFKENKIDNLQIKNLINTLLDAHISTHITDNKSVAVQIFELQNSRGIKLDLIEKVKAKLMKELYLYSNPESVDEQIKQVQDNFSEIYRLEEKTIGSSFRGEISLENILFHHLRVIDDGTKLLKEKEDSKIQESLNKPSYGNDEDNILNYLSEQLATKNDKVDYILNLSKLFEKSIRFFCETLIQSDAQNPLIGDCLILDRYNSLELYLILLHLEKFDDFNFEKWELLLFTRDFHEMYYNKKGYRDNFQWLFQRIISQNESFEFILDNFIDLGFRGNRDGYKLQETYLNHIEDKKNNILNNAFNFHPWKEKMTYLLYKYEINLDKNCRVGLREVFKDKKTLDHILPQNWQNFAGENITENLKINIDSIINGIGNLIIVTQSENSTLSDKKPSDKTYKNNQFGSYKKFEGLKSEWENSENWDKLISNRSNEIYNFLVKYFTRK